MKNIISIVRCLPALLCLVLCSNCYRPSLEQQVEKLPVLPPAIASTLDTLTLATKINRNFPDPIQGAVPLAPCCGITDVKSLKVSFPYTKCGPLRDFIVAQFEDFVLAADTPEPGPKPNQPTLFKYSMAKQAPRTILDQIVCMTSSGPWDATLTRDQPCNGYQARHTLIINAFGDQVIFVWNGGLENHPPEVQLVSCRQLYTARFNCGGLSQCDCSSSACPQTDPCECNLQW